MDFGSLPMFSAITKRLAWLSKRQQVLAQNIANADTPGYRARDLKEVNFRELMQAKSVSNQVTLSATSGGHIRSKNVSNYDFKEMKDKGADLSLAKNSVVVEEQMMKVANTTMNHQLMVNLYRKHIAMIKLALGRPGG